MPTFDRHTLPIPQVLLIIVRGKVKVMDCCSSVTFLITIKIITLRSLKLIQANLHLQLYDHTHQLSLPNSLVLPTPHQLKPKNLKPFSGISHCCIALGVVSRITCKKSSKTFFFQTKHPVSSRTSQYNFPGEALPDGEISAVS